MSDSTAQEQKIEWDIEWRDSSNARVKFCSDEQFFASSMIPAEAKETYDTYCKMTKPETLEKTTAKNGKQYYKCTWTFNDTKNKATYTATYDDQYAWGIMKVPLKESVAEQKARFERIEKLLIKLCEFHKIDVSNI